MYLTFGVDAFLAASGQKKASSSHLSVSEQHVSPRYLKKASRRCCRPRLTTLVSVCRLLLVSSQALAHVIFIKQIAFFGFVLFVFFLYIFFLFGQSCFPKANAKYFWSKPMSSAREEIIRFWTGAECKEFENGRKVGHLFFQGPMNSTFQRHSCFARARKNVIWSKKFSKWPFCHMLLTVVCDSEPNQTLVKQTISSTELKCSVYSISAFQKLVPWS